MVLFNNFAIVIKVLCINEPPQPMNDKLPDSQVICLLQNELESIDTVFFRGFVFLVWKNEKQKMVNSSFSCYVDTKQSDFQKKSSKTN